MVSTLLKIRLLQLFKVPNLSQNVSINTQNSFITIIQGVDVGQNNRMTIIEGTDVSQNTRMAIIEGTDVGQNTAIHHKSICNISI
jgi:flagellar biogenesis protein FliO